MGYKCGKKDAELLATLREDFINGAVANGEIKEELEEFWEMMSEFARYTFNKSHSISYAYLSYYTAYLKCHFPVEMYCAAISCETDIESQSLYINDAQKRGIKIIPPSINNSNLDFNILNGKIIYGLKGLKCIGDKAIQLIIENRPYINTMDFFRKIVDLKLRIPKQVLEALIKIGAFDEFGVNRRVLLDTYDKVINEYKAYTKKAKDIPLKFNDDTFFNSIESPDLTLFDILTYERQYMGIYISGNPFDYIKNILKTSIDTYEIALTDETSSVFCEVLAIKEVKTKAKGEKMAIYKAIDSNNTIFEFPLFPEAYNKYSTSISEGSFIIVNFKKQKNNSLICLSVKNINSLIDQYTKDQKSENNISSISIEISSLSDLKKILTRKEKDIETDESLFRPCYIYLNLKSYLFKIGTISFSSTNNSIRLLNQIENIKVFYNR